jgi:cyclopropane-fatty-acyl-phospholipid synthase
MTGHRVDFLPEKIMTDIATSPHRVFEDSPALRRQFGELFAKADIRIDGKRPWDIQLKAPGVLSRIASRGSLGLGESYVDGDWEAERLDEFFRRLLRARLDREVKPLSLLIPILRERAFNRQNARRVWEVGEAHYDLGNDFYQTMLGPTMAYTCAYWQDATSLEEAQLAKWELVCRKLRLRPGMRLLDIGCGWGGFMAYAARKHGVKCVGITVSKEQQAYAAALHADSPVEIRLQDYRDLDERFDAIASIGMFEHVGKKNYRGFMRTAHRCLAPDGVFLLQTIGKNERRGITDPWIEKHIFPNGELPSIGHIHDAIDGLFVAEDLHNFGPDYDRTLMAWHRNFEESWAKFADSLGTRFFRKWRYYLLSCAGAFRARDLQLWQWTLSKQGIQGGCQREV